MARHTFIRALCFLALAGCTTRYELLPADSSAAGSGSLGDGYTYFDPTAGSSGMSGTGGVSGSAGMSGGSGGTGGFAGMAGTGGAGGMLGTGGSGPDASQICRRGGPCEQLPRAVDKVDLLLMVDNSSSMEQEQESVREQLPRFLRVLTTGDRNGDGAPDFRPAKDLHLGVVSSDLGLPGLESAGIEKCLGLGDRGELKSVANAELAAAGLCSATQYSPPYLAFVDGVDDLTQTANDLSCIATLGIDGCGFEQQLESALKAVWPGSNNALTFVTDPVGFGQNGNSGGMFPNGAFNRDDSADPSLLAIMLVTDEEDCSSRRMDHFVPGNSPNGLNTRCHFESLRGAESNLFQVERYIEGFKALRPGREDLVLFNAIVGVPQTLVTPDVLGRVDFSDLMASDAFYDGVLEDPRMQERIDDKQTPDVLDDDGIVPSCDRGDTARAYPPRRIVEVAKAFGEHGVVQSICQDDFTQPFDAIVDRIAAHLGERCLDRPLARQGDRVACDVYWQLTTASDLASCNQRNFLTDAGTTAAGAPVCKVNQLSVVGDAVESGDGFFYDDFSDDAAAACTSTSGKTRIAYSLGAQPPAGVTVWLDCD